MSETEQKFGSSIWQADIIFTNPSARAEYDTRSIF